MENLRKLGVKKALELLDCHCDCHAPPSGRNRSRRLRANEKLGGLSSHTARLSQLTNLWSCGASASTLQEGPPSRRGSCLAELFAQLVLGPHQVPLAGRRQALAGTIDVEGEHGQRGSKWAALAAPASFRRAFQRGSNPFGIPQCEDALVEGKRIAVFGHMARPASAAPGAA